MVRTFWTKKGRSESPSAKIEMIGMIWKIKTKGKEFLHKLLIFEGMRRKWPTPQGKAKTRV